MSQIRISTPSLFPMTQILLPLITTIVQVSSLELICLFSL
jgi:hypothetical protein